MVRKLAHVTAESNVHLQEKVEYFTRDDSVERSNKFPVPSVDSLVVSSCFFLLPALYGFMTAHYLYALLSVITTVVSVNYWRHPVEGWRRTADLITAKVSFIVYFFTGYSIFIRDWGLMAVALPGCICIIGFYMMSNRYWDADSPYWVYLHMLFHLFVALEQFLVLYSSSHLEWRGIR